MKWKEFVKLANEAGVRGDDEIWYIDMSFDDPIEFRKDTDYGWAVG